MMLDPHILRLAQDLGALCLARKILLATAESCTGGGIASAITDVPGSSGWFDRGFVTYSNESKEELLGVPAAVLAAHGAVSEETARAMVAGALAHGRAQAAVAVTGIAGPAGGSADKPVGLVWFAWGRRGGALSSERRQFRGDREAVRRATVVHALQGLIALIEGRET